MDASEPRGTDGAHGRTSVLITGGSRGIGAALVARLASAERRIYLNHRDSAAEAHAVQRAVADQGEVRVVQADIRDRASVAAMMRSVREAGDALDVLIHSAALPILPRRVQALDWAEHVQPQLEVASLGLLHCVQEGDDLLRRGARVVVLLSDALVHAPPVRMGAYLIAKGALWGLTRALAKELQPRGVTVTMVSPGMTDTSLLRHYPPRALEIIAQDLPLGRLATTAEVADAIARLLADPSQELHGANVVVGSGATS